MAEVRRRSLLPRGIVFFTATYMVVCSVMALRRENVEFLGYAGSMVVFIALVLMLNVRVRFSHSTLWMLSIWGALHMLGGTVPIPAEWAEAESARTVLYGLRPVSWLPRYDQWTHAFGFGAATVAAWEAMRHGLAAKPGLGLSVSAALIGMGLGAVNEMLEFFVALTVEQHGVGGYTNTGWDLVSNAVGCVLAGILMLNRR